MHDFVPPSGPYAGDRKVRLILVTGVAGAGKTSTLAALADHGFETIDNPPIGLLDAIMDDYAMTGSEESKVAIGIDERSRGFTTERCANAISGLRARSDLDVTLLFLECSEETLLRRFKETRRRHPMAGDDSVEAAMTLERAMLEPIREQADASIDTTALSLTDLRHEIGARFGAQDGESMTVSIISFGFKRGSPREADMMFDVRFLTNPYWSPELREMTGLDPEVEAYIATDPAFREIYNKIEDLVVSLLPHFSREGKSYLNIAIGCTGGRHRSVAVAEKLGAAVRDAGFVPAVRHRDLRVAPAAKTETKVSA